MGGALVFASQLLNLVPIAIQGVAGAVEAFNAGKDAVKRMVAENRDPTDAEWAALNAATESLRSALQSDDK